jgi:nitrate reductase gamma subunit
MLFDSALYVSLAIFVIGVLYRLAGWFSRHLGAGDREVSSSARVSIAARSIARSLFSKQALKILKSLMVDVVLQWRILKDRENRRLWIMHILIFVGFILLLFMHALGSVLTRSVFPDYQSTLNPFLFLRNLFGVLVFIGLILAVVRRASLRKDRVKTAGMDYTVIVLFVIIVVSGFLLEATKISSHTIYRQMVEDYATVANAEERKALEVYWVEEFGVVSAVGRGPFAAAVLAKGKEVHQVSCASCHSKPQAAFISYPLSRVMKPAALGMDEAGLHKALWIIHFLACFVGLAYLPFSKMFHVIATPVSLLVASAGGQEHDPAALATRKVIELDGCSHGGTCHLDCPVRQKRQERINLTNPFGPEVDFLREKSWKDLGCRSFQG